MLESQPFEQRVPGDEEDPAPEGEDQLDEGEDQLDDLEDALPPEAAAQLGGELGGEPGTELGAAQKEPAPVDDADRPVKGPPSTQDPDVEIANPDTPMPSRADLMEALEKAFSEEEDIGEGLLERYAAHAELMLAANCRMNLTAILEPYDIAVKHYLDSWRATRLLPLMGRSVLDLGTGAGFPGIPIAMAEPNTRVMLCDSTRKRVEFLEECIEKLALKNCSAVWDRAEEHLARNKYDIVIVRGVSSVRENVRTLRKVRHSHKDLVMLKGPSWSREARAGEREVERLGFRLDTVWEHTLPLEKGGRAVLVFRAPGGMGE